MLSIKSFIYSILLFPLILASSAEAVVPAGVIELSSKDIIRAKGFYCGYVKRSWIPGRLLAKSLFYSNAAEVSQLKSQARKATGSKKVSLEKKANSLASLIKSRAKACKTTVNSTSVDGEWSGNTDSSHPFSLHVINNQVTFLETTMTINGSSCKATLSLTVNFSDGLEIKDHEFVYQDDLFSLSGSFDGRGSAKGKYSFYSEECQGEASASWKVRKK